jgi:hypothetical protein
VLFWSDRTCCVCREKGKAVQIHHIDGDNTNGEINNLAVLCLDCHTETQIHGGFHRKLDSDQVLLYRADWYRTVARDRTSELRREQSEGRQSETSARVIASIVENLREAKEFGLVAMEYDSIGAEDLRDKYIELALSSDTGDSSIIFFRSMQNRADLIPKECIDREVRRKEENKDWSQLARLFVKVGDPKRAALFYCKSIMQDIEEDRAFPAAYYLKELCQERLFEPLFERAYGHFSDSKDLWWQVRSLEELGWKGQLHDLVRSNRAEIEASGNPALLRILYEATGEKLKMEDAQIAFMSSMRTVRAGDVLAMSAEPENDEDESNGDAGNLG